jgi:hypothetical protein
MTCTCDPHDDDHQAWLLGIKLAGCRLILAALRDDGEAANIIAAV